MTDLRKAAINMLDRYLSLAESGVITWRKNKEKECMELIEALMKKPCQNGSQCVGGKCPECEWIGLTDEEVADCFSKSKEKGIPIEYLLEGKLKEKNSV
jgi:hypothetical protein